MVGCGWLRGPGEGAPTLEVGPSGTECRKGRCGHPFWLVAAWEGPGSLHNQQAGPWSGRGGNLALGWWGATKAGASSDDLARATMLLQPGAPACEVLPALVFLKKSLLLLPQMTQKSLEHLGLLNEAQKLILQTPVVGFHLLGVLN